MLICLSAYTYCDDEGDISLDDASAQQSITKKSCAFFLDVKESLFYLDCYL